jgi:hypothetical protein
MNKFAQKSTQILTVNSLEDFLETPFIESVNSIGWTRQLKGDFAEIVNKLECKENMREIDLKELKKLDLSAAGKEAVATILTDMAALEAYGAAPILNLIKNYERDDSYPFFPTDVYSYHVDRSPIPTETILCTYHGAASDILPNAEAEQKIKIPEIRAELLKLYGGEDNEDFEAFLIEYFFDLHYQPKIGANPINLGIGNLWKLAVDCTQSNILPSIHRAPSENDGEARLLLIC